MFKFLLQGRPFGHPLHPLLVHFPIALFVLGLVMDLASYVSDLSNLAVRTAYYAIAFGMVGALLAAIAGFADWSEIRIDHPSKKTANLHMTLNLIATALFGLNLYLRTNSLDEPQTPLVNLLLSMIAVVAILVSGYLGGTMVYDNGVGVGRHRRETRLPRRTIDVSMFARRDGWVAVCDADDLKNGETLRIDWDGTVIAIVRQKDKVYAFQEFCTHRYGPLSEGKLSEYQIECPWHRSCFDIRTGKVTEGPAKLNLKTYSAAIQGGKILIGSE